MTLNSIVLVTGASGGIGRALVERLKARGLQVAAVGRELSLLKAGAAALHIEAGTTTPQGAAIRINLVHKKLHLSAWFFAQTVGA